MATRAHLIIFDRDGGACTYCGARLESTGPRLTRDLGELRRVWQVDHVLARERGGNDSPDNLVLACGQCNLVKGGSLLGDWDPRAGRLPAGLAEHIAARSADDHRARRVLAQLKMLAFAISMRVAPGRAAVLAEWAALTDSGLSPGPPLHAFVAARATRPTLIHSALHGRGSRQHLTQGCPAAQRIGSPCSCVGFEGELCEWCGPLDILFPSPRRGFTPAPRTASWSRSDG